VLCHDDAAVVTARQSVRGDEAGAPFGHDLRHGDLHVRTPAGWKYLFGQASLPAPHAQ
jgi:hypothetical protein